MVLQAPKVTENCSYMSPKSNKNLIGTILMHYFISHYDKTTNNIYLVYKVFLNLPVVLEMF
jgi:hypothetical protein